MREDFSRGKEEMSALDALWGATLREFMFNVATHSLVLSGEATENGSLRRFSLVMRGISELRFLDPNAELWDYAEITSTEAWRPEPNGPLLIRIVFWKEEWSLTIQCSSAELDGRPLE